MSNRRRKIQSKKKKVYPDYVVNPTRINNKNVMIVARNNLRIEDFKHFDGYYLRKESFDIGLHLRGETEIRLYSDKLNKLYSLENDYVKVLKNGNKFNIKIIIPDKTDYPIIIDKKVGCLHCKISIKEISRAKIGTPVLNHITNGVISPQQHFDNKRNINPKGKKTSANNAHANIAWAMLHPFGGGAVRPR